MLSSLFEKGPSEVRRIDGSRVALIRANLAGGALAAVVEKIGEMLRREADLAAGMTSFLTGQNQEWERSKSGLWLALGVNGLE